MATIVYGKTICSLCGKTIQSAQDEFGFSAFVANELDALFKFSDAVCHLSCLDRDELGRRAKSQHAELLKRAAPDRRICAVCGKKIQLPDDYFALGYLTDDHHHPLYPYNYVQLHRSCIPKWDGLKVVLGLISDLKRSGAFRGAGIDWIQKVLSKEAARTSWRNFAN